MTDNEIIELAERCIGDIPQCSTCPLDETMCTSDCMGKLIKECLSIINRQRVAIDELKERISNQFADIKPTIKINAYNEFAKRLRAKVYEGQGFYSVVTTSDIEHTLKELTERKEDEGK